MDIPHKIQINQPIPIKNIGSSNASSSATNIPFNIADLPKGTVLRGNVGYRNQQGHVVVHTAKGDIALKTNIFMKTGTEIMMRIENDMNQMMAKIIRVDGKSLEKYVESIKSHHPEESHIVNKQTTNKNSANQLIENSNIGNIGKSTPLRAVLSNSGGKPIADNILKQLPPNIANIIAKNTSLVELTVNIKNITLPNANPNANPSNIPKQANQQIVAAKLDSNSTLKTVDNSQNLAKTTDSKITDSTIVKTQTAKITPQTSTSNTSLSTNDISAKPNATATTTSTTSATAPVTESKQHNITHNQQKTNGYGLTTKNYKNTTPNTNNAQNNHLINATIIQDVKNSAPTLQSPIGTIRLFSPASLPVGTQILLNIVNAESLEQMGYNNSLTADKASKLDSLKELSAISYQTASNSVSGNHFQLMPQLGKTEIAAEMLFFLAAIKGGDVKKWLDTKTSSKLDSLSLGKLANKIDGEFSILKSANIDAPKDSNQWNSILFPALFDEKIQPIAMYYRNSKRGDNDKNMENIDHFVVDIELSNLGKMQFDGFVAKPQKLQNNQDSKYQLSFDLIIRSHNKLAGEIENNIRQIYQNAIETIGAKGNILFKNGKEAILKLPDIMQNNHDEYTAKINPNDLIV